MVALTSLLTMAGCEGVSRGPDEMAPPGIIGESESPSTCTDIAVGATELQPLSSLHYTNTVRDLLGVEGETAKKFPADEEVGPFRFKTSAVTGLQAEMYRDAAEEAAALAVQQPSDLVLCDPEREEAACVRQIVEKIAPRAYRMPVAELEVTRIVSVYESVRRDGGTFASGLRVLIAAILQSPRFLYHLEPSATPPGTMYRLSGFALASRLSYFLWDSMPDDALFKSAETGELETEAGLRAQVDRLLTSPRAREAVGRLHRQWLRVDDLGTLTKDPVLFPSFTPSLALAMRQEITDFANHVIFQGDGRLGTLLTAGFTVTSNPDLLALYGLTVPQSDGTVLLDPTQRAGLFTRAAPMAALASSGEASPIKRGVFVRRHLLCQPLPPPPEAVVAPNVDANASTRERFAQHSADPACAGCHRLIDPVGFGFENYDAIGAYQAAQGGGLVDASGELTDTDVNGAFNGALELSAKLAESAEVRNCVASQWFRFALARTPAGEDACAMGRVQDAFATSGGDVRDLARAIVASDSFRYARTGL